ncbi:MAG: hypothetical protein FWE18_02280 [Alphaproteobacteria bacterium]|nr:hypothetical protein [Alphaproteobacteria bacterium]
MKKILLSIFIFLNASFLYAEDLSITAIEFIKEAAKNEDIYIIQGVLTQKLGDNEYLFQDASGSAPIIIPQFVLVNRTTPLPLNSQITIKIAVNKEIVEHPKFEAFEILKLYESPTDSSFNITPLLYIQQTAINNETFAIKGTIVITTDVYDNQYQFKDTNGDITSISVKELAFKDMGITKFNDGDNVILRVVYHKDSSTNNAWLEVNKILELNNSVNN